jgi:hypothetical protein
MGSIQLDEQCGHFFGAVEIGITNIRHIAVRGLGQLTRVRFATNAAADDGCGEFLVGADRGGGLSEQWGRQSHRGGGHQGVLKKAAASQVFHSE